jgi:hypothetical protein
MRAHPFRPLFVPCPALLEEERALAGAACLAFLGRAVECALRVAFVDLEHLNDHLIWRRARPLERVVRFIATYTHRRVGLVGPENGGTQRARAAREYR